MWSVLSGGHLIMGEEAVKMTPSKIADLLLSICIENVAYGFRTHSRLKRRALVTAL